MDILLCSVPWVDSGMPVLAPAVLKSAVTQAGFQAQTLDLSISVYNQVMNHTNRNNIVEFFTTQYLHDDAVEDIAQIIEQCAQQIADLRPRRVGLSLLSQDSQYFTWWMCYHLKHIWPEAHIVIGGSGIKNFIAQGNLNFAEEMRKTGLIDDYIFGDGEIAMVEYLKGNMSYPGINSNTWLQVSDLDSMPYADFMDYDFSQYTSAGIPICDSRGCVRTCEFCDIIEHWKKYKYRTADNIFTEMMLQIDRHNIKHFHFYNSLTNGNMKEFTKLLDLMADYNQNNADSPISWDGYFIVRDERQHPEHIWEKLKLSNARLMLGIESVVEHVRKGLGKNFSNADIDYHLAMAKKYHVPLMLLLIVGYPTENQDDFEFTKQWFLDRAEYAVDPVYSVQCTLSAILPGTKLERNQEKYGITKGNLPTIWMNHQTNIGDAERLDHLIKLKDILNQTGMTAGTDALTQALMEQQVNA